MQPKHNALKLINYEATKQLPVKVTKVMNVWSKSSCCKIEAIELC